MRENKVGDFDLITITETSRYLRIPVNTLYKNYTTIPHIRIGNRILFCKVRLNDWLEEQIRKNQN